MDEHKVQRSVEDTIRKSQELIKLSRELRRKTRDTLDKIKVSKTNIQRYLY